MLAQRAAGPRLFQNPPNSIGHHFDEPTMLMGISITHPDPGHAGNTHPHPLLRLSSQDTRLLSPVHLLSPFSSLLIPYPSAPCSLLFLP